MQRLWFITNPGSGSATPAKCEAVAALFDRHSLDLAGTTHFPEDELPGIAALESADVDTVVLFAGDGTINASLCKLANWDGGFLILPGGTMNMLAKALHDSLDPAVIVDAAVAGGDKVAIPYAEAGPHRAFVGLILGPAAHWFRAREAARKRRLARLMAAARFAWRRTFGGGVRIAGVEGIGSHYQAVFVTPQPDGLSVSAIDARDWRTIANLGWSWLTGEWAVARAVSEQHSDRLTISGHKPVLALFDGEPQALNPGTEVTAGMSRPVFITTRRDAAAP